MDILTTLVLNDLVKSGDFDLAKQGKIMFDQTVLEHMVKDKYALLWEEMNHLFQTPKEVWPEIRIAALNLEVMTAGPASISPATNKEVTSQSDSASDPGPERARPTFTILP